MACVITLPLTSKKTGFAAVSGVAGLAGATGAIPPPAPVPPLLAINGNDPANVGLTIPGPADVSRGTEIRPIPDRPPLFQFTEGGIAPGDRISMGGVFGRIISPSL